MTIKWNMLLFAGCLLMLSAISSAQDTVLFYKKPLVPNYINTQFAGNVGAMVLGAGYRMNRARTLEWVLAYGYTPKYEAARRIHTISFKNIYIPFEMKIGSDCFLFPVLSVGISRQFPKGNKIFITLPNTYPKGYYAPNAFRFHLNAGAKFRKEFAGKRFIEAVEFYAETTTNDLYLNYYLKSRSVRLSNIFSTALGMNLVMYNLKKPGIIFLKNRN